MKLDDETFLTAYIDGTLPAGQRESVESALAADPRLAEELRGLVSVRDIVAGLPRPAAPADLSGPVLERIGNCRPGSSPFAKILRMPVPEWTGSISIALASAAALLVAGTLAIVWNSSDMGAVGPGITVIPPRPKVEAIDPGTNPNSPSPKTYEVAGGAGPSRNETLEAAKAHEVQRWLDRPELHKVFVVTDVLGRQSAPQVGSILEKMPRRNAEFGKITVAQGIVLDPQKPGKATVYVVLMDDNELNLLRQKLNDTFRDGVKEDTPNSSVVTQLADIGQVSIVPGTPVADLVDNRLTEPSRAIRSEDIKDLAESKTVREEGIDPLVDPGKVFDPGVLGSNKGPTPEQLRSGPHPGVAPPAEPAQSKLETQVAEAKATPPARREPPPHVVLVWVTSPA